MPMLDVHIPEGALTPDAEATLLDRLSRILLAAEGADPDNAAARSIAWAFLHRPAAVYVAGRPAAEPHYRVVASVPEGQWTDNRRERMVADVTRAILTAEGRAEDDPEAAARIWVFALEIPDGTWGGHGRIHRLADIAGYVLGDPEAGAAYATHRLTHTHT